MNHIVDGDNGLDPRSPLYTGEEKEYDDKTLEEKIEEHSKRVDNLLFRITLLEKRIDEQNKRIKAMGINVFYNR